MYVYINRNNLYNSYKHFTFLIIYQAGDTSFEFIDENIFYSEFPREDTIECVCEEICGNDCLNRRSFDECSIDSCKLGMLCDNNQIRKKKWASIETFLTEKKGLGVKANQLIKEQSLIIEYAGEIVLKETFEARMNFEYANCLHHYGMDYHKGFVIDAYHKGNEARCFNHSCQPNCEIQKWFVDGVPRMCIFSKRDIQYQEE